MARQQPTSFLNYLKNLQQQLIDIINRQQLSDQHIALRIYLRLKIGRRDILCENLTNGFISSPVLFIPLDT